MQYENTTIKLVKGLKQRIKIIAAKKDTEMQKLISSWLEEKAEEAEKALKNE